MSAQEEVEEHIRDFFREHVAAKIAWLPGPAAKSWPQLYFLAIAPGPRYTGWVYVTVGASAITTPSLEFFVCSPHASGSMAELLAMVAYYHASEGLGLNHTLPIGRPWLANSECDQLLISLPYPFGPQLENAATSSGNVQVLWLLPITMAERTYAKANGVEALESLFDEHAINPLDPNRSSVV